MIFYSKDGTVANVNPGIFSHRVAVHLVRMDVLICYWTRLLNLIYSSKKVCMKIENVCTQFHLV